MIWAQLAFAGSMTIHDRADVLDPLDETRLRQEAAALPFDTIVLTTAEDPAGPATEAKRLRTRSREVVVAVDPEHRKTWAEIGAGVGLQESEFQQVADAGAVAFKQKRWSDGLMAMMLRAATPAAAPQAPRVEKAPKAMPLDEDPSVPILAVVGGLLALATVAAVMVLRREDKRLKATETTLASDSRRQKGSGDGGPPIP